MLVVNQVFHKSLAISDDVGNEDKSPHLIHDDMSSWTVDGGCVKLSMSAKIKVENIEEGNYEEAKVPSTSSISNASSCAYNDSISTQAIVLEWKEFDHKAKQNLSRKLSLIFTRNSFNITPTPSYRLSKVQAVYEQKFNSSQQENKVNNSSPEFLHMETEDLDERKFHVPFYRSFSCNESLTLSMSNVFERHRDSNETRRKTLFVLDNIQFDAFRSNLTHLKRYQPPMDCKNTTHRSDILPVIVGGSLAGTVVLIVICYLLRQRKIPKAKGYSNV